MKVLGKYVLVEEILTKKDSPILHVEEKPENEMIYISEKKILELGPEFEGGDSIKIGDVPLIAAWANQPAYIKVVEGKSGDYKITRHLIFPGEAIIGTDNPE